MAVKLKIVTEPDNEGNVSFTEKFLYYIAEASKNIKMNNPKFGKRKESIFHRI